MHLQRNLMSLGFRCQRCRRPNKRPVKSKKETVVIRFQNRPLLGFDFMMSPEKCRLGRVQRNPTKPGVGSTQPTMAT
ncbi:hypothetical protein D1AOALGA4SA_3505 [Olavius algarvensis Delta 1 endosymbiont]|nr:hypothetical protein D1AOALGA4SA_3505 [Olavius algarvensis Delta 1 endosymbiont]